MGSSIRIVVVEDDIQYLEEITLLLKSSSIDIIGTYTTGKSGLKGILEKRSQVALINLGLPDISGIEIIREIFNKDSKREAITIIFVFLRENNLLESGKIFSCSPRETLIFPAKKNKFTLEKGFPY